MSSYHLEALHNTTQHNTTPSSLFSLTAVLTLILPKNLFTKLSETSKLPLEGKPVGLREEVVASAELPGLIAKRDA